MEKFEFASRLGRTFAQEIVNDSDGWILWRRFRPDEEIPSGDYREIKNYYGEESIPAAIAAYISAFNAVIVADLKYAANLGWQYAVAAKSDLANTASNLSEFCNAHEIPDQYAVADLLDHYGESGISEAITAFQYAFNVEFGQVK